MNVVSKKIHKLTQSGLFARNNVLLLKGHGGLILPGQNPHLVEVSYNDNLQKLSTIVCYNINSIPRLSTILNSCMVDRIDIKNIVIANSDKNFTYDAHSEECFDEMEEVLIFSHPCEYGIIGDIGKKPFLSERFKKFAEHCDNVNIVLPQDENRLLKWFDHLYLTNKFKNRFH